MNVPLLDLKAQYRVIKQEVMSAIEAVCDEQGFVLGPRVVGVRGSDGTVYRQPLCDRLRLRERCAAAFPHGDGREGRR